MNSQTMSLYGGHYGGHLSMWVVYEKPRDYPNDYVARLWLCSKEIKPTNDMFAAPTLDELRRLLPAGLTRLDRHPDDDPAIVEVWL